MKTSTKGMLVVILLLALFVLLMMVFQPAAGIRQEKGFALPPGDPVAGAEAFADLGCMQCHTVDGSDRFGTLPENPELHVALGGEVRVVKTYGELVTAIIHPTESVRPEFREKFVDAEGRSLMPDLTAQMSTRQLIDLVAYLQGQYELVVPAVPENYYPYGAFPNM